MKNVNCVANDDNSHEVERALHVCSPRCSALNSSCPVTEPRDGEQSEEDDILNTSDQNEMINPKKRKGGKILDMF